MELNKIWSSDVDALEYSWRNTVNLHGSTYMQIFFSNKYGTIWSLVESSDT